MKAEKKPVLKILLVMISLTVSRAMNILQEEEREDPSHEIMENIDKKLLDAPLLNVFKDDNADVKTTTKVNDQIPELAEGDTASTIVFSILESEIHAEKPSDPSMHSLVEDSVDDQVSDQFPELSYDETFIPVFSMKKMEVMIGLTINTTNDTIDRPTNNDSVEYSALNTKDSKNDFTEDPTVYYVRGQPKIFTVHVREFYECVSCHADFRARKYYDQCLQKLSLENQNVIKSCCNASFDNDFCNKASTGKINYFEICQDPGKALKVADCFWEEVKDKETGDIELYRECKRQILESYCTEKSSSDIPFDMDKKMEKFID